MSQAWTHLPMLHWEMLVRLSFKTSVTSEKIMARMVHPVGMDRPNLLMGNLFAQAPAQLQAQVLAQLSRESTMCVILKITIKLKFTFGSCIFFLSPLLLQKLNGQNLIYLFVGAAFNMSRAN